MLSTFHKILENPSVYDLAQKLLGSDRVFKAVKDVVAIKLKNISYNNVLEVGCGTYLPGDYFTGKYVGIDINKKYIRKARAEGKGFFGVADAAALPFGSKTFDLIFTLGVLHHLDVSSRINMLSEMWRVCKTGGCLLLVDGLVPDNKFNVIGYILAKLDRGSYKVKCDEFKEFINVNFATSIEKQYKSISIFPYELIIATVCK